MGKTDEEIDAYFLTMRNKAEGKFTPEPRATAESLRSTMPISAEVAGQLIPKAKGVLSRYWNSVAGPVSKKAALNHRVDAIAELRSLGYSADEAASIVSKPAQAGYVGGKVLNPSLSGGDKAAAATGGLSQLSNWLLGDKPERTRNGSESNEKTFADGSVARRK